MRRRRTGGMGRTTKLAIAAQVVAVVLLVAAVLVPLGLRTSESGPSVPPTTPEEYTIWYNGEVLWHQVDKDITHRYVIGNGGILTIVDSDLRVYLEDMVLLSNTLINVQEGGTLVLENSTLTLVADERLLDSVIMEDWAVGDPYLTRVVNLARARAPTLEMEVNWRGTATIWVVVQEDFYTPLIKVAKLTPGDDLDGRWEHFSVPLDTHVGGIVKLGLIAEYEGGGTDRSVLVSGLKVLDGGGVMEGDLPFTGNPTKDGWYLGNVRTMASYGVTGWFVRMPLMETSGSVVLRDSVVSAPSGVPRYRESYRWSVVGGDPSASGSHLEAGMLVGGHFSSEGGHLVIERSVVSEVPMVIRETAVRIEDSQVQGLSDPATLVDCTGTVEGSTFMRTDLSPWPVNGMQGLMDLHDKYSWGIGVEGNSTGSPLTVSDCEFVGFGTAVLLYEAPVRIEACDFKDIGLVAVWDHSNGSLTPDLGLLKGSTFNGQGGLRYLRTTPALVRIWDDPYDQNLYGSDQLAMVEPFLPYDELLGAADDGVRVAMPRYVVDSDGVTRVIENVTLSLDRYPAEPRILTLDATRKEQDVFLREGPTYPYVKYHITYWGGWLYVEETNVTGTIDVVFYLDALTWLTWTGNVTLELRMGDRVVGTYAVIAEDEEFGIYQSRYNLTIAIPPGPTRFNATLAFHEKSTSEIQVIDVVERTVFRVTDASMADELVGSLESEQTIVVVDPGVVLVISDVTPLVDPLGDQTLEMTLFNGSIARVTDMDVGDGHLFISVVGNGTLDLVGTVVDLLVVATFGPTLQITDATVRDLLVDVFNANASISGVSTHGSLDITVYGSTLTVSDSHLSVEEPYPGIWLSEGVLRMSDSTIEGTDAFSPDHNLTIQPRGNSTVEFESTTFKNLIINVYGNWDTYDVNLRASVRNCTFTGAFSVLSIIRYDSPDEGHSPIGDQADGSNIQVVGSSFAGERAGLVLSHSFEEVVFQENSFTAGARFYTHYNPNISYEARTYIFINGSGATVGPILGGLMVAYFTEVFIDVTDDPGRMDEPGEVLLALRAGYEDWPGQVLWFTEIDPTSPPSWIPEVDWGPYEVSTFLRKHG